MIKISLILFFTTTLLFAAKLASCEEQSSSESSVMASIRPKVEYIAKGAKEPFEDYFSKKKPAAVKGEAAIKGEAAVAPQEPRSPLPSLTVKGIIWGSSTPCAIINNKVVKQGDSIEEVRIIKIEKESIEVLYRGWDYSLSSPANLSSNKKPEGGKNE